MSFIINSYSFGSYDIPTDNLVLYLRLDNSVTDETGNFTVTNNGVSFSASSPQSGTHFGVWNTNTDSLTIPDNSLLSFGDGSTDSPFSLSFWVYSSSWANNPRLFDKRDSSGNNKEYRVFVNSSDNKIRFNLFDDSSGGIIARAMNTALSTSSWHHCIFTYDGSSSASGINVYLNGSLDNATLGSAGTYTAMENLTGGVIIGKDPQFTANTLSGNMDSVALWDVELTSDQASDIYAYQNLGNELL